MGVAAVVAEAQDQSQDFIGVAVPDDPECQFDGEASWISDPRGPDFILAYALCGFDQERIQDGLERGGERSPAPIGWAY